MREGGRREGEAVQAGRAIASPHPTITRHKVGPRQACQEATHGTRRRQSPRCPAAAAPPGVPGWGKTGRELVVIVKENENA